MRWRDGDAERLAAVGQHQAGSGQSADRTPDIEGPIRAGDHHIGDICRGRRARAVGHGADLPGGLDRYGNVVHNPIGEHGAEAESLGPELMSRFSPLLVSARPSVVKPLTVPDKVSAESFEPPPHPTSDSRVAAIAPRAELPMRDEPCTCRCTCIISWLLN